MAPCREASHHADEEETTPLAPVPAAAAASMDMEEMERVAARTRRKKQYLESLERIVLVPPAPFPWWRRLPFLGPTRDCVAVGQPLDPEQIEMLRDSRMPGHFEVLAWGRQVATDCLDVYNSSHPDNEYEPAPGEVTQNLQFNMGTCWIHGNFVARRKRSGCLSFLPASRILFFFEISCSRGSRKVVTCTPLDEPVTEAYSILGFPLWWSKHRSGKLDTICNTCSRRFYLSYPVIRKISLCGHNNTRKVCEMCYHRSNVLHPNPKVFWFGGPDPGHPN